MMDPHPQGSEDNLAQEVQAVQKVESDVIVSSKRGPHITKGVLAIAIGILLAAGGGWFGWSQYTRNSANASSCNAKPFSDVEANSSFCGEIQWMKQKGMSGGYQDGSFHPYEATTREEMATFLYNYVRPTDATLPATPAACADKPFTDVPTYDYFCGAIAWMKAKGLTTGYSDGTFRATDTVNRDSTAAFLYRIARLGDPSMSAKPTCTAAPFKDVPVSHPFCGEITWLKNKGITTGYADGTYKPSDAVNHDAMAAFIYRGTSNAAALSDQLAAESLPNRTTVAVENGLYAVRYNYSYPSYYPNSQILLTKNAPVIETSQDASKFANFKLRDPSGKAISSSQMMVAGWSYRGDKVYVNSAYQNAWSAYQANPDGSNAISIKPTDDARFTGYIGQVATTQDGSKSYILNRSLVVFDSTSGQTTTHAVDEFYSPNSLALSSDSKYLAVGKRDSIMLYDTDLNKLSKSLDDDLRCGSMDVCERRVIGWTATGVIAEEERRQGDKLIPTATTISFIPVSNGVFGRPTVLYSGTNNVRPETEVSRNGKWLAYQTDAGIALTEVKTGNITRLNDLDTIDRSYQTIAFSPDSTLLVYQDGQRDFGGKAPNKQMSYNLISKKKTTYTQTFTWGSWYPHSERWQGIVK